MQFHFRYICNVMFTSANGDRANAPNYIVIFTDGKSDNRTLTWQQVNNPCIATSAYMLKIKFISVQSYHMHGRGHDTVDTWSAL